jgi:alkyldihydroxyacetonephosphate synthase
VNALTRDLSALLGSDAISDDPADRSAYAHDFWPRQLLATRGGLSRPEGPGAVAWPRDTAQLAALVGFARKHGVQITPYGAGSAVTGALALSADVVAVDTKRMRRLHSVDLERGLAVADAGMLGEHLEQALGLRGATLGHFPSSIYCSTLGGWLATRGAGQCSGRYGKIEDMVVGLEGVLGSGEPFACGPAPAGRVDARALLVGSEGLYGFLTRATMRVWPAPTVRRFGSFSFKTMERAWTAIRAIFQAGLRPAVARLYDPFDTYIFKTGGRHKAGAEQSKGRARPLSEFVLRRLLPLVGPVNRLNERFGERVFGRSLLVLMFEGTPEEGLDDALARAATLAAHGGGRDEGPAYGERWLARRHAVSYRLPPTYARGLWVDTMEVAAPWSRLGALYHGVHRALGETGFVMAHMSHAYPDGCSIYFTFAGGGADDAAALEGYSGAWARGLRAAHDAGGTISHHHGIGRAKRRAMRLELGAGVDVIQALKRAADPDGVMAPGPLVPPPQEADVPAALPERDGRIVVDAESRLAAVDPDVTLAEVARALSPYGLALRAARGDATVRAWLATGVADAYRDDPVDHVVAGYVARLPNGATAWTLAAPRRAAGPDLLTLFACGGERFGRLTSVTLRAHHGDEAGPAWKAPCEPSPPGTDAALEAWLARVSLQP